MTRLRDTWQRLVRRMQREDGFTLVEILAALIILAILMAMVMGSFRGSKTGARANAMRTVAAQVDAAVQVYNSDFPVVNGSNPLITNLGAASPMTGFGTLPTNGLRSREGQPLMDVWPENPYVPGAALSVRVAAACPTSGTPGNVFVCRAGTAGSTRVVAIGQDSDMSPMVVYDNTVG